MTEMTLVEIKEELKLLSAVYGGMQYVVHSFGILTTFVDFTAHKNSIHLVYHDVNTYTCIKP